MLPKSCPGKLQLQSLLVPKRVLSPTNSRIPSALSSSSSSLPSLPAAASSAPPPRLTDTLRRLGERRGGRDAIDVLNELLAEAEAAAPLSPRSAVSPAPVSAPGNNRRLTAPPPPMPPASSKHRVKRKSFLFFFLSNCCLLT